MGDSRKPGILPCYECGREATYSTRPGANVAANSGAIHPGSVPSGGIMHWEADYGNVS